MLEEIKSIIKKVDDFDFMMYKIDEVLTTRLSDQQIRDLCEVYFKKNETPEQLEMSNQLFRELHHRMTMLN